MKRILLIFILCVLITGCGENKLKCTKITEKNGITSKYEYEYVFTKSGDKVETFTYTSTYVYKVEAVGSLQDKYQASLQACAKKEKDNDSGYACSVKTENTTLMVKETIIIADLPEDQRVKKQEEYGSRIDLIEKFDTKEYSEYTCK